MQAVFWLGVEWGGPAAADPTAAAAVAFLLACSSGWRLQLEWPSPLSGPPPPPSTCLPPSRLQVKRCADAGADIVRITVQSKREAEACMRIRERLFKDK